MPVVASPAVARALDVLELLSRERAGVATLSELARRLGMPRATCNTVVMALTERGYITRTSDGGRFVIGPACIGLSDAALVELSTAAAQPVLDALAAETGLLAMTTTKSGDEMMVTAIAPGAREPLLAAPVDERVPLRPPFGAAFVAWNSATEVSWWLDRAVPPLDADERDGYAAVLNTIRARGFSVSVHTPFQRDLAATLEQFTSDDPVVEDAIRHRDQLLRDMVRSEYLYGELDLDRSYQIAQISAPVFDEHRRPLLLVLLLGPVEPLRAAQVSDLGHRIQRACRRLGEGVAERLPDGLQRDAGGSDHEGER
jgi:DNA-binding IclR family transcriptional regulator